MKAFFCDQKFEGGMRRLESATRDPRILLSGSYLALSGFGAICTKRKGQLKG